MTRRRARRAPRLRGRRPRRALSRDDRRATTSGGTRHLRAARARSAPSGSPSCPAACCARRRRAAQPRGRRARRRRSIVGPVFPHEVVGFSGGNKYLFPGVSGQEIIDLSHWLGALITSAEIIGTRGITPVRALIDEAAALVPAERLALCVVTRSGTGDAARGGVRRPAGGLGRGRRRLGADPRPLPRRPGPPGAVADPGEVRRHVDRRQGLLQGRAGRRRRRPGRHLRAAHHRDLGDAPGDRRDRLPLPRLLRRPVGPVPRRALGRPRPLDPPARRRHLRRGRRRAVRVTVTLATGIPEESGARDQPRLPRPGRRSISTAWAPTRRRSSCPEAGEVLYRLR